MDVEKYIGELKSKQAALALDALLHPKGRDGFAYGEASGRVQGMQDALDLLNNQLAAADGKAKIKSTAGPVVQRERYSSALDSHPLLPEEQ